MMILEICERRSMLFRALLLALTLVLGAQLNAHTIDRNTSFAGLARSADLIVSATALDSNALPPALRSDADYAIKVVKVFSAPSTLLIAQGDRLAAGLPFGDRENATLALDMTGLIFLRASFATPIEEGVEQSAKAMHWELVPGPYLSELRELGEREGITSFRFMGLEVSDQEIRTALEACPQLAALAITDEERERLGLASDAELIPLADHRITLYSDWLAQKEMGEERAPGEPEWDYANPILALSALFDAYELGQDYAPLELRDARRAMPEAMGFALLGIAELALSHHNKWFRNAAMTIVERLGTTPSMKSSLRAMCLRAAKDEEILLARQEAHRYLGACMGADFDELTLLLKALDDDRLRNLTEDYPSEGIRLLLAQRPSLKAFAMRWAQDRHHSGDWYKREAALRVLRVIGDDEALTLIKNMYRDEAKGELKDALLEPLLDWQHHDAIEIQLEVAKERVTRSYPGEGFERALASISAQHPQSAIKMLNAIAAEVKDADALPISLIAAFARCGDHQRFEQLLALATSGDWRAAAAVAESLAAQLEQVPAKDLEGPLLKVLTSASLADSDALPITRALLELGWCSGNPGSPSLAKSIDAALANAEDYSDARKLLFSTLKIWLEGREVKDATLSAHFLRLRQSDDQFAALDAIKLIDTSHWPGALERLRALAESSSAPMHLRFAALERIEAQSGESDEELALTLCSAVTAQELTESSYTTPRLGPSSWRRAEARALIPMLIAELEQGGNLAMTYADRITLVLNNLTGESKGFCSAASLSPASVELMAKRWRSWYAQHGERLAWDTQLRRFVVHAESDEEAAPEDED